MIKTYIFWHYGNLPTRGGRSTLANQGSLYHVSWRPRLPHVSERHKQRDRRQIPRGPPLREDGWRALSTRVIMQCLSICFIVNRLRAKQIKWVKSDPVSAAFFLGNHYTSCCRLNASNASGEKWREHSRGSLGSCIRPQAFFQSFLLFLSLGKLWRLTSLPL